MNTKITIIGSGNVATHLGMGLFEAGYMIAQVYSPTKKHVASLAGKLNAEAVTDLSKLNSDSTIYIIAVKDDVIEMIAKQLRLKNKIVVHTSGTASMNILKAISENYGVLYPLQTFSKSKSIDLASVPMCIEANNKATATTLQYFSKSISRNVQMINSDQRKIIHLAAVFANNFSNHMFAIAEQILKKNKLPVNILRPLISETVNKIADASPAVMQTGPAKRGDKKTMEVHLKMLAKDKQLKDIYQLISNSIISNKP